MIAGIGFGVVGREQVRFVSPAQNEYCMGQEERTACNAKSGQCMQHKVTRRKDAFFMHTLHFLYAPIGIIVLVHGQYIQEHVFFNIMWRNIIILLQYTRILQILVWDIQHIPAMRK